MKKLNSFVGWTLMLAVLAVPSFLFYNWWAANAGKAAAETVTGKTDLNVFPEQPGSTRAVPSQPDPFPAAARPAQAPPQQAVSPGAGMPAVPAAAAPAKPAAVQAESRPPASTAAVANAAAVSTAAAKGDSVAASTAALASYFSPKTTRDPTMSPENYRRIREARAQAIEEARQLRASQLRKNKSEGIESRLKLQGIVGNAVILNGEMFYVGQTIHGAKILKVGSDYMIGEYKGKRFRKALE